MSRIAEFGVFEAHLDDGELRKQGRVVRLQKQPFELLRTLIESPNEVVTRDMLRRRLWPSDVVVDFDQSLNKCVTKLRDALGDSASTARYIETVPKRGYRFLAPVTVRDIPDMPGRVPLIPTPSSRPGLIRAWLAGMIVVLGLVSGYIWWATVPRPSYSPAAALTAKADPPDPASRQAYDRGRVALLRRSEEGFRSGIQLFERSAALDPRNDAAYVGLADAWSLLASYGLEEPQRAMSHSRAYAARALALNPRSVEAHTSLGRTKMIADWDGQTAEWHFRQALDIRPGHATAHQWYAYLMSASGRHKEAERQARQAASIDSLSINTATAVGYVMYAARQFNAAADALREVIAIDPDFVQARRNLGLVLLAQGQTGDAIREFERILQLRGDSPVAIADLAWARGKGGDTVGARQLAARLEAAQSSRYVPADSLALARWAAGQQEEAVVALTEAFDAKVAAMAHLAVDPIWDDLRAHPKVAHMASLVSARLAGAKD